MKLISPNNTEIVGTAEVLTGWASIENVRPNAEPNTRGHCFDFDYEGETHINWNEQRTVVRDGYRVFVDAEGNQFLESELRLVEE